MMADNWLKSRIKSFGYAFKGIALVFKEPNAQIHLVAAIVVVCLGFYFKVSPAEWIILSICIGWVIGMEMLNSALENLADSITKEKKESIRKAKDLAAGAVLVSAIISAIIGVIIFYPKIVS